MIALDNFQDGIVSLELLDQYAIPSVVMDSLYLRQRDVMMGILSMGMDVVLFAR